MNINEPINYVLYARKSTEEKDRQTQSITDQINSMKTRSKMLNLNIVDVLVEEKSAKTPATRPVFSEMLNIINTGKANGIITWKLNRLSRNPIDSGTIQWMLQQRIIKSIVTSDSEYLPDGNAIIFGVETGQANQFVLDLSKDVKRGMQSKLEKGWFPHLAPIGYLNAGHEKGSKYITKDAERFDMVRKMWDLFLTGNYSVSKIANIANDEWGYQTKETKNRKSGKLSAHTLLDRVFSNIFYVGIIKTQFGTYTGSHEPMVTLEEFEKAQVLLGRKDHIRPQKRDFAYTGLLKCGECGCGITAELKTKPKSKATYTYYHCTYKKPDKRCTQRSSVRVEVLEAQIMALLEEITILPQFKDWAIELLRKQHLEEMKHQSTLIDEQKDEYKNLNHRLNNLLTLRLDNEITKEEYDVQKKHYQCELVRKEIEIRNTEQRTKEWFSLAERAFEFACSAKEKFEKGDIEIKKSILSALGSKIVLMDKKLSVDKASWLIPIQKSYPALKAEFSRLENSETLDITKRTEGLDTVKRFWSGRTGSNRRQPAWKADTLPTELLPL